MTAIYLVRIGMGGLGLYLLSHQFILSLFLKSGDQIHKILKHEGIFRSHTKIALQMAICPTWEWGEERDREREERDMTISPSHLGYFSPPQHLKSRAKFDEFYSLQSVSGVRIVLAGLFLNFGQLFATFTSVSFHAR